MDSIDSFDENSVWNVFAIFYERGNTKSLPNIGESDPPPVNFSGFTFKTGESGRHILVERKDIVAARCIYLRILNEHRNSANPPYEVYLDETWVNQNESVKKRWTTSDGKIGPKLKTARQSSTLHHLSRRW